MGEIPVPPGKMVLHATVGAGGQDEDSDGGSSTLHMAATEMSISAEGGKHGSMDGGGAGYSGGGGYNCECDGGENGSGGQGGQGAGAGAGKSIGSANIKIWLCVVITIFGEVLY